MFEPERSSDTPGGPMTESARDKWFMHRAIDLARRGWGLTTPNPMVGAVIVEDGLVVSEGYHLKDGGPHAEIVALTSLGRAPKPGATLYVTLEPCSTLGRTGACTEAILAAGIRRVVAGATDPSPDHSGRGFEVLRQAGVEVVTGVLESECQDLNLIFNHWVSQEQPFLAAKLALTLDGRIATRTGDSQWITGEAARADVHRWRRLFPAIAVGGATVIQDNPRLTSRLPGEPEWCPLRIVFDGLLRSVGDGELPRIYTDEFRDRTIVVATPYGGRAYARKLQALGVKVWIRDSPNRHVPLPEFRERCMAAGITGVLIEGGGRLVGDLLIQRQIDYLFAYRAPLLFGDAKARPALEGLRTEKLAGGIRLADVRNEVFGDDVLTRGRVVYPEKFQIDETAYHPLA
jgi:diaminohydroxyphosphoribosylaminopyrimidine deaminase/5-amino-6-(5-phosphoribosylamino)uracil reductase